MGNLTFFQRFRLRKPTVRHILVQIQEQLVNSYLNLFLSPANQLLTTLRFYATNGHLSAVANFLGMHLSTSCRIICRVSHAIALLSQNYIKMPEGNEVIGTQISFFQIASLPKVIGCIDCTHIRIKYPGGDDAEVFLNRKGYFSLNVQMVRWPGSAHDQTIFINSRLRSRFEASEFPNCIRLGNAGYAVQPYLFTPLANPTTRPEQLYNESQIRTRNTIERHFRVCKCWFPLLAYGLRCDVQLVQTIIVATAVLQNVALEANYENPPPVDDINDLEFQYLIDQGQMSDVPNYNNGALNYRGLLIQEYFAGL